MSATLQPTDRRERTFTGSSNASMRTNLNDQLAKLQIKHQAEVDFLEDMRNFSKQRSAIEREYSQSLQRLVQQYISKRDIKDPPEVLSMDRTENRGLLEVWKMLLQKTEEVAKARQNVAEMLLSQISEDMRQQKRIKEQAYKRYIELAQKMNLEVSESVKELVTCKKTYSDLEKVCSEARQKFNEAETRLRKGDRKLFESLQSLEKSHKKFSDRLKQCQKKTAVARNEYLISVATTNAHLHRHATKDLPNLMRAMDGEMYERARNAYMLYAQIEADAANLVKADFEDLREQAFLVNREYVVECFLHKYPILKDVGEYKFEPHDKDSISVITRDHGAEIFLEKDARKWASRLVKHQTSIMEVQKQVKGLRSVTTAYTKNPEFGTSEAFSEAQSKIEECEESIRQLEVKVTKAEARLETLRGVGVDVSRWLEKAQGDRADKSTSDLTSLDRPLSGLLSVSRDLGASEDKFEWLETSSLSSRSGIEDAVSISSNRSENNPKFCIALYEYQAQRSDELDIHADEELEVLDWDDGDGWCKGRNHSGQEGYFPQNYVQPSSRSSTPPSVSLHQVQLMVNSQFGGQAERQLQELGTQPVSDVVINEPPAVSNGIDVPTHNSSSNNNVTMLRALYEYTAQDSEELSFPEGAAIELLRTDDNGVDDGWWEGRYQGNVGVFPSVVVEIITNGVDYSSTLTNSTTPVMDSTLLSDVPPPSSPPPIPLSTSPSTGPPSLAFSDQVTPKSSGHVSSGLFSSSPQTPKVRVQIAAEDDLDQTWKMDSFDDFDGEESAV